MQRVEFIDTSKGIGIILVVFGHVLGTGEIHDYIYSFHMPLFFIICGFVGEWTYLSVNEFSSRLCKNIQRYCVPYFILMLIAGELSLENIKNYILVNRNITYMYPLLAKWYLPCFFVSICLALLLHQLIGKIKNKIAYLYWVGVLFVTIVLMLAGLYFNGARCGDEVLWLANIALTGCAFIYVGILLRVFYDRLYAALKKYHWLALLILMTRTSHIKMCLCTLKIQ